MYYSQDKSRQYVEEFLNKLGTPGCIGKFDRFRTKCKKCDWSDRCKTEFRSGQRVNR